MSDESLHCGIGLRYRLTDIQTDKLRMVTWQRWRSHHSIHCTQKPHTTRKRDGSLL